MASVELKNTEAPAIPEVHDRTAESDSISHDTNKTTEMNRRQRRRPSRYRKIPRSPADDKENKGARLPKGGRQRTTSVSSVASTRSQRRGKPGRRRTPSEASSVGDSNEMSPLRKLRETIMEKFEKKGLNLLNSFIKNKMELAKFENTTVFLERCDSLQIVPNKYRLTKSNIKNTKNVVRELDRCSLHIMFADLKYNRKRRFQVNKLLGEKEGRMQEAFGEELVKEILQVSVDAFDRRFNRIREQQMKIFESLCNEYQLTPEERAEGEERRKRMEEREKSRQEKRAQEKLRATENDEVKGEDATKDTDDSESKADGDKLGKDKSSEGSTDGTGAAMKGKIIEDSEHRKEVEASN